MQIQLIKPTLLFLLLIIASSCKTECNHYAASEASCYPNSNKPKQVITYEEMADMMDTFENGPKKELNKYLKKVTKGKDSISTNYNWYKLDDLKQYIAYIERISKEKEIPVTGFRIYPSTYPKNYKDKKLRHVQTLIFTPTTSIGGNQDIAFEPLYSKKGEPTLVEDYLHLVRNNKLKNSSYANERLSDSLLSSSANRLRPSPPY